MINLQSATIMCKCGLTDEGKICKDSCFNCLCMHPVKTANMTLNDQTELVSYPPKRTERWLPVHQYFVPKAILLIF